MLFQIVGELIDGDPVHSRTTFITLHLSQCFLQVLSLTYFLHQPIGSSWAFGSTRRHQRFSLFSCDTSGCTRQRRREVQFQLDVLLLVVFETHGLLTTPSRSGLLPSFPARPIHCSAFRHSECLTSLAARPTMPSADFCSAVRLPLSRLSRRSDTEQISWGKFSHFPCTDRRIYVSHLDGYGLRGKSPARPALAPSIRFLSIDSHVCSMLPSDPASRR